jgi:hypothetical protein
MRIRGNRGKPERRGGGTAIARPVEGNKPDTALGRELLAEAKVQPGSRGPMKYITMAPSGSPASRTRTTRPPRSMSNSRTRQR